MTTQRGRPLCVGGVGVVAWRGGVAWRVRLDGSPLRALRATESAPTGASGARVPNGAGRAL